MKSPHPQFSKFLDLLHLIFKFFCSVFFLLYSVTIYLRTNLRLPTLIKNQYIFHPHFSPFAYLQSRCRPIFLNQGLWFTGTSKEQPRSCRLYYCTLSPWSPLHPCCKRRSLYRFPPFPSALSRIWVSDQNNNDLPPRECECKPSSFRTQRNQFGIVYSSPVDSPDGIRQHNLESMLKREARLELQELIRWTYQEQFRSFFLRIQRVFHLCRTICREPKHTVAHLDP